MFWNNNIYSVPIYIGSGFFVLIVILGGWQLRDCKDLGNKFEHLKVVETVIYYGDIEVIMHLAL